MCKDISILTPANCVSEATQEAYKDFSAKTGLLPFVPFSVRNIVFGQYMAKKGYTAENASTTLSIPQSNIRENVKKGLKGGDDLPKGAFFDSLEALFENIGFVVEEEQIKAFKEAFTGVFKEGMTIWKGEKIEGVKTKDKEFLKEKGFDIEGLFPVMFIAPTEAENHIKGRCINSLACEAGFRNPEKTRNGAIGASGNEHEEIAEASLNITLSPAEISLYCKDTKAFNAFIKDLKENIKNREEENEAIRKDIEARQKAKAEEEAKRKAEAEAKAKAEAEKQQKQASKMSSDILLNQLKKNGLNNLSQEQKAELLKLLA